MDKYPSIETFRTSISNFKTKFSFKGLDELGKPVYDSVREFPIIRYRGTVKLHGSHADVLRLNDGSIVFQSRNNLIMPEKDNAGFATYMSKPELLSTLGNLFNQIENIMKNINSELVITKIMISGEWCGGNIQKGVALSLLEKMFVIFGVKINDEWCDMKLFNQITSHKDKIYNIMEFQYWEQNFDLNNPILHQNYLVELTNKVEKCCPVGKYFGVNGIGEGIVWNSLGTVNNMDDDNYDFNQYGGLSLMTFKVKGEEHSVSKVKTLVEIDLELIKNADQLVDAICTENRLKQGLDNLREQHLDITIGNISPFIKWVIFDIMKEELERINASGFDDAHKESKQRFIAILNRKITTWYKKQLSNNK